MGRIDADLARIASGQNRIITTGQLRDLGLSKRQVGWLFATERATKVHRGVHLFGAGPLSFEERATALCFAYPEAVLSHSSTGRLLDIRKSARERLEATIPTGLRCDAPDVKVHRSNRLDPQDVFHRLDGIRHTSPERLLFDQAAVLDGAELRSALHDVINRNLTNVAALHEIAERMVTRGRRGSVAFMQAVGRLEPGFRPAESDGELQLAAVARSTRVPTLERQYWVRLPTGAMVRIDLAEPNVRLGIEFDHSFWHAIPSRVQADKSRDVQLSRLDWAILRFTENDLCHPAAVARAIEDVYFSLLRKAA